MLNNLFSRNRHVRALSETVQRCKQRRCIVSYSHGSQMKLFKLMDATPSNNRPKLDKLSHANAKDIENYRKIPYSAVYLRDDQLYFAVDNETEFTVFSSPAYISFTPNGTIFGESARNSADKYPIIGLSTLIGTQTPTLVQIENNNKSFTPAEILSVLILAVKEQIEHKLQKNITQLVAIIPQDQINADYCSNVRTATELAGMKCIKIQNDGLTAIYGYDALESNDTKHVLQFDVQESSIKGTLLLKKKYELYEHKSKEDVLSVVQVLMKDSRLQTTDMNCIIVTGKLNPSIVQTLESIFIGKTIQHDADPKNAILRGGVAFCKYASDITQRIR